MMDFPNAPAINQIFGSYVWDGEKWKQITVAAGTPVASVALPLAAGTASAGTASPYSREDHVHPAAGGGGALPGTLPPLMDGAVAVGISNSYTREDHRHPTDTSRAPLVSPAFTGNPTAPTPLSGDADTSIATTAFVMTAIAVGGGGGGGVGIPATELPLMDGTAAVGVSAKYTREDHVHPFDTSRAPLNSPVFTGDPRAPTPGPGDNDTTIATTAFVAAAMAGSGVSPATVLPLMDGTPAVGSTTKYAREDHIHPTDSTRAPLASPTFTGDPKAPTPAPGDNDTSLATTAFVATAIAGVSGANVARGLPPGGRLSFSNGNPVMSANVVGTDTTYYLPYKTGFVPVYDGALWSLADIGAGLSNLNSDATKNPFQVVANSIYDYFIWNDIGVVRLGRSPAWSDATTRVINLTRQDGVLVNGSSITNGPLATRGTWVGTAVSNATGSLDWIRGSAATAGAQQARLSLWNAHNRVSVRTIVSDSTASWTYASATWRSAGGTGFNRVSLITGGGDDDVEADYRVTCEVIGGPPAGAVAWAGIGIDSTTVPSGISNPSLTQTSATTVDLFGTTAGTYAGRLAPGSHVVNAIERVTTSAVFYGVSSGAQSMGLVVKLNM
jgi:hypothetical protein